MRRIILPQAIRIVIPAIGNEFIAMIKDSALVSIIGVQELLWRAQAVGQSELPDPRDAARRGLVYWVLTIIFSFFQERLERRMAEATGGSEETDDDDDDDRPARRSRAPRPVRGPAH